MDNCNDSPYNYVSKIKVLLLYSFTFFIVSCESPVERLIIVNIGCDEFEITSDIQLSIDNNRDFLNEMNIAIEIDTLKKYCGYKLIKGEEERLVKSAMTDIDLLNEVSEFYNIK